jgi:hypothetical protein
MTWADAKCSLSPLASQLPPKGRENGTGGELKGFHQ